MARFYLIAFAVTSLLPALCQAAPTCADGEVEESETKEVLTLINNRREALVNGTQKNGGSGKMLPPAKGMTTMTWSCELEKAAKENLKNHDCLEDFPPGDPQNRTELYTSDYEDYADPDISIFIKTNLDFIDTTPLQDVTNTSVKYKQDALTYVYSQVIRATTTQIGCTLKKCVFTGNKLFSVYCLTDKPTLKDGEVIYEVGVAGTCEGCPQGTECDPTTKLCVAITTPAPATTPPSATTATPSPLASFPSGTSTKCNDNRMTDALRDQYISLHNYRRSQLAVGKIAKNNGNLLPKASNMLRMTYDCKLEEAAIQLAGQCGSAGSAENTRSGEGENFKRFPAANFPTFADAAKKSVTEWWKVVRKYPGIGMAATFRAHHVGTPIVSFTQMSWATSNMLGCSIVKCASDYVGVCRYSPKGNIVGSNVYIPGAVCSACRGSSCTTSEGLC